MTGVCTSSPGLVAACSRRTESLCLNHGVAGGWSAVQLPGPLYAVLDLAASGRVVCVDREGEVRHTVYSQDTSPGYQDLYLPEYMTTEQCGRLLLADTYNDCVQLVSASGSFLQRVVTAKDDGVWLATVSVSGCGQRAAGCRTQRQRHLAHRQRHSVSVQVPSFELPLIDFFLKKNFVRRAITGDFYDLFMVSRLFNVFCASSLCLSPDALQVNSCF